VTGPPVSVVVVSRDRPAELGRCLTALGQLYYHPFEIVVVADPAGAAAVGAHALGRRLKLVGFDVPNIAAARNLGLQAAGGDIVAFIDDDAVAEPTWLNRLVAPIADRRAGVAGGFVRGRNGVSHQWRARTVGPTGEAADLPLQGDAPEVPGPPAGHAVKTEGTNMAVFRRLVAGLGGFDERFRFYLDETDLNMRVAAVRQRTALVPLAEVHHGFAASPRRRDDRVPLSLHEIGASSAVFWGKYLPEGAHDAARDALLARETARAERHRRAGRLTSAAVAGLIATLHDGLADGAGRAPMATPDLAAMPPFLPLNAAPPDRDMRLLSGPGRQAEALIAQASAVAADGGRATVIVFDEGFRALRVGFDPAGFWLHRGGRMGKTDRDGPRPLMASFAARVAAETQRIRQVRFMDKQQD